MFNFKLPLLSSLIINKDRKFTNKSKFYLCSHIISLYFTIYSKFKLLPQMPLYVNYEINI